MGRHGGPARWTSMVGRHGGPARWAGMVGWHGGPAHLLRPNSRFDPIGGSELVSGRETIYWDSLPALSDINISNSYNYINISYSKVQNKTTTVVVFTVSYIYSTESHLHIQKLYIYIYCSERGTYIDEPLLVCWPGRMRNTAIFFFCTYMD